MADGLQLLVNDFEPGDFALCAMHLEPLNDPDHRLVSRLLDLCNAHPGADALDCLLYVYALSPCSTCRKQAVSALMDAQIAPEWLCAECQFDADPATRLLVSTGAAHAEMSPRPVIHEHAPFVLERPLD